MKSIKISITILMATMILAMVIPANAQDQDRQRKEKERKEMSEKMKAAKIAYISEHVALTPEEAEKFWPVYNEHEQKRMELTKVMMERFRNTEEKSEISDEKAEEMMQERFKQEEALLDLKKEYHNQYLNILSASKVLKLYEAENSFKHQLMERMGQRRQTGEKKSGSGSTGKPYHRRPMGK